MIKKNIVALLLLLNIYCLKAQMSNTLYFMERIPQSQTLNPAIQPKSNVYVGFPGISSWQFNVGNNSLSISSILQKGPNDSLITFLNDKADPNIFYNDLKEKNSFFFDMQGEILSLGFRKNTWYFNAGISVKGDISMSYSKDLAKFLLNFYQMGDYYSFKNTGFNSTLYGEFALGASKIFNENWTFGTKVKILNGLFNFTTRSNEFSFRADTITHKNFVDLVFTSDLSFDSYLPVMESTSDTGKLEPGNVFTVRDKPQEGIKFFECPGLGFDFGATYKGIENVVLSASVLDLGFISWRNQAQSLNLKVDSYRFGGIELKYDSLSIDANVIGDSINNAFSMSKSAKNYISSLPTKLYLAGEYAPVKFFSLGLLSLTQYYRQSFYQQIMVSANLRPWHMLMFSFSYSFFDNGFSNLGFGTSLRLGPTQFYLISDNIPFRYSSGIPLPYKATYFNVRFGFNLVFGCNENKKVKDKPLNY